MEEVEKKQKQNSNPMEHAGVISKIFFWWLNPLFRIGNRRPLEVDDMYPVMDSDSSKILSQRLQKEWDIELEKQKDGKKPCLRNAMIRTFGKMYMFLGLIAFAEEATKVVQPLLMGGLIRYFSPDTEIATWEAYLYALGVGLCAIVIAITHHPYFFMVQRVGMWLRVASCSMIFKKSLRLSNRALGETTTGQIVNLMSNDVMRFDQTVIFLHFLWIGPLQAICVLVILYYQLGPASLAGFAILLLLIPVQGFMGRLFSKLRRKTAEQTDERVRLMNEILNGMRVIKMYCWEKMFGNLVHKVRKCERSTLGRTVLINMLCIGTFEIAAMKWSTVVLVAVLGAESWGLLVPSRLYPAIALFLSVNWLITMASYGLVQIRDCSVSIDRIERFLLLEELEETSSIVRPPHRPKPSDCKVTVMNLTAKWDEGLNTNTLDSVNFEVRAGELLAVIGPVGAGKSSLLMALLGELTLKTGSVKMNGEVAYVSQQPWVFSASLKQNILFGQTYDVGRYNRVIKASALSKDIEIMPDGDDTLVGERGVSLSGGQKARVSLARALYFDADIYLLDDPLSAVDAAVSRHIFDKCICGVLRNKPVILVTHQLQYLQAASKILVLKEGTVMGLGTYNELAEGGVDFAALLKREDDEDALSSLSFTSDPLSVPSGHHGNVCANKQVSHVKADDLCYLSKSLDCPSLSQVSLYADTQEAHQSLLSKSVEPDSSWLSTSALRNRSSLNTGAQAGAEVKKEKSICNTRLKEIQSMESLVAGSMVSLDSIASDVQPDYVAPQQPEEERAVGTVGTRVYMKYFYRGAGVLGILLFVILNILAQGSYILADWWLSYWATEEENRQNELEKHESLLDAGYNVTNVTVPEVASQRNLYIYTGITISVFIFGLLRALHVFYILVTSAKHLHNQMFASIIRCPVLFFDTNPVGRILNRFSKDMGAVDETLPLCMYDFLQCALMILGIVLVAGVFNPWVFIPTLPLGILFVFLRRYYLNTSRDIKRLEATTRSPVFSLVSTSLQGLQTVRAYHVQDDFTTRFDAHQDGHSEAWFLFLTTSRWLAVRLDWLCAIFITAVALCSVLAAEGLSGGVVGLSLTYAIGLMGLFQWGVRQSAEVENQMTSVERIMEYAAMTPEASLDSAPGRRPPSDWPQNGVISAEDACLRYSDDGAVILRDIKFCVRTKEKVGIVGRTGAGKSSLIAMLFRLAEPSGKILIDDVDILGLGLHDLRSKISIIPQDPMLFTGTIRRNLDPFQEHEDETLWRALEEVQLKPAVSSLPESLEFSISEGGVNFSVGQRQLICLARAILKQNRILIIDEATANVDPRTDSLIQQTIREKFRDCSVLTIAHRLNTIMDSDRVMVLHEGQIREFDEPYTLLQDDTSLFHEMVSQVGVTEFKVLFSIAKDAYFRKDASYDDLASHQEPTVAGGTLNDGDLRSIDSSTAVKEKSALLSGEGKLEENLEGRVGNSKNDSSSSSSDSSEENIQFPLLQYNEAQEDSKV